MALASSKKPKMIFVGVTLLSVIRIRRSRTKSTETRIAWCVLHGAYCMVRIACRADRDDPLHRSDLVDRDFIPRRRFVLN
jgi:hypothetical protein